jgi:hypothetical protein
LCQGNVTRCVKCKAEQPTIPTFNLRNPVLVEIWSKQVYPAKQVENVFFADELTAGFGLYQNTIEFVQPAFGSHVQVRSHLVTFRVADEVQVQVFGAKENSVFYLCWHWLYFRY